MPRAALIAQPFAQAWPLAETLAYAQAEAIRPDHQDHAAFAVWRKEQFEPMFERMKAAVAGHIKHLVQTGGLPLPAFADRVDLSWLGALKRMHDPSEDAWTPETWVVSPLEMALMRHIDKAVDRIHADPASAEAAHDQWVGFVEAGTFAWHDVEKQDCAKHGFRVGPLIQGWNIELATFGERYRPQPLTADLFPTPTLQHLTLPVPSGELWINDWFRVDAFTAITEKVANTLPSINSEAGQIQRTQAFAEQLGFVSVCVGNTSPTVWAHGGRLVVGDAGWDDDGEAHPVPAAYQALGSVCTDLWWTSCIDKQVLIDLVATRLPLAEAQEQVEAWAQDTHSLMRVQVPPGTYHLYFAGSPAELQDVFQMEEVDLAPFQEPRWVLSPEPLTPKMAPRRKLRL